MTHTPIIATTLLALCMSKAAPVSAQTKNVVRVNPVELNAVKLLKAQRAGDTAVEVGWASGEAMVFDFYDHNIFRLTQSGTIGMPATPQLETTRPKIARKWRHAASQLTLTTTDTTITLATPSIEVSIDRTTALIKVIDRRDGTTVVETIKPATIRQQSAALTLACRSQEMYDDGSMKRKRRAHGTKNVVVEHAGNWRGDDAACSSSFFLSTYGYAMLWSTDKPGHYDFGARHSKEVNLCHDTDGLDIFFMIDRRPKELLKDYKRLSGKSDARFKVRQHGRRSRR